MKAIRLIIAIGVLAFIGYRAYDFYMVEQNNEMVQENDSVVDTLTDVVETRDYIVTKVIEIFNDGDGSVKEETRIMMFGLMDGMLADKVGDMRERLTVMAANNDNPSFDMLVDAGHAFLDSYEETSGHYDQIIALVVADPANRADHVDQINELLTEAEAKQDAAADAFELVRVSFEAERKR